MDCVKHTGNLHVLSQLPNYGTYNSQEMFIYKVSCGILVWHIGILSIGRLVSLLIKLIEKCMVVFVGPVDFVPEFLTRVRISANVQLGLLLLSPFLWPIYMPQSKLQRHLKMERIKNYHFSLFWNINTVTSALHPPKKFFINYSR